MSLGSDFLHALDKATPKQMKTRMQVKERVSVSVHEWEVTPVSQSHGGLVTPYSHPLSCWIRPVFPSDIKKTNINYYKPQLLEDPSQQNGTGINV